ncbi:MULTISPECIES: hypothetical protein [Edwardsiella]|uniref:Uncharacterized protein n=2 Tax=Edwardsiella anguillarum TaxID=1821960 RepID=A0A076LSS7_9GAMM|nr:MULTISPECIES: hypothetical protein [Edwardsiella]AKM48175.1 hypothetical protein QY76_13340 [Edwardsiella sp. EA181011]AIJ09712.1 Hypothetical protein ETEE_3288 [Edwardsiella anguillarum ET080813]AKR77432.1 hypothetical protein AAZ33_06815 [Edwardsiella sp. LADL05-105]KAB0592747.1 hypothetical protein F7P84_04790 [Edwardsiella anguillarum]MDA6078021.1 hypothetical protein [Edwardsiella anguillarum]
MNTKQLTPQEKALADELALERVYAMNNDEYLLQRVDEKIHRLEAHVKAYVEQRFAFHRGQA